MSEKKPVKNTEPEVTSEVTSKLTPEIEALIKARVEAELDAAKSNDPPPVDTHTQKEINSWLNEKVSVKLMKDSDRYKSDVFVGVNGKGWLIKRGEHVLIPRYVAMALEQSLEQDEKTAVLIEMKTADFERKVKDIS